MFLRFVFFVLQFPLQTESSVEQAATTHFFTTFYESDFQDEKRFEFRFSSHAEKYVAPSCGSFDIDQLIQLQKSETNPVVTLELPSNMEERVRTFGGNKKRIKVQVNSAVKQDAAFYVLVKVYKLRHFVYYYHYRYDSSLQLLDVCKVHEVI